MSVRFVEGVGELLLKGGTNTGWVWGDLQQPQPSCQHHLMQQLMLASSCSATGKQSSLCPYLHLCGVLLLSSCSPAQEGDNPGTLNAGCEGQSHINFSMRTFVPSTVHRSSRGGARHRLQSGAGLCSICIKRCGKC